MVPIGHQFVDLNPNKNQLLYEESESERTGGNQSDSQINTVDDRNQGVQAIINDQFVTQDAQGITDPPKNITVFGRVETEFGDIIAGETVTIFSPSLRAHYSIVTSDYGEFTFADLKPAWDYILKVSPQGMFKRYTKSPIKLRFVQEMHNIVLESIPLGVLTGRIVDSYDRPVAGIELSMQTLETDSWSTDVVTDGNGAFSVTAFPKGRFQVATRGLQSLKATGLIFDPDIGERVSLTIDLGPYRLGGRIYDESGRAFDGASVIMIWALQKNGISIRSTRQTSADVNGIFHFTELGPGNHKLVVSAWRGVNFRHTFKKTVNVGVDPGELNIVINTL
jgi:hypothetical protein